MGHNICAILLRGVFDPHKAQSFDLHPILLVPDITMFPLDANYCDHWARRLDIEGAHPGRPLLNTFAVHHMVRAIAPDPLFAIIETDYFGGAGDQAAAVYQGDCELMAPTCADIGPINQALRLLGVKAVRPHDEFHTVGLRRFRDFDRLFESYDPHT